MAELWHRASMVPMFAFTALLTMATLALVGARVVAASKSKKPKLI